MTEYHDHPGDEQHDAPLPDADLPHDAGDTPDAQHLPPPPELSPGDAAPPEELHFPGDELTSPAPAADLDPAAPWPDDGDFQRWLADPAGAAPSEQAGDAPAGDLPAAPESTELLASSDELVDWTLRRLADEP